MPDRAGPPEQAVPAEMNAAYLRRLGGPEEIRYGRLPVPTPGPTDVLVRVAAVSVNKVDTFVRSGAYATPTPFPFVIGRDLLGTVVAGTGPATGFRLGERVWCASLGHAGRQGATGEYAAVPVDRLYRLPAAVTDPTAVAALHPAMTAWLALHRHGRVEAGETVYVGGGAGGVGSALVRLAAEAGARVIASAREADTDWCISHGADLVVDYRTLSGADPSGYAAVESFAPDGVDLWIETSGRHDLPATVCRLAFGGRIVLLSGLAGGAVTDLPVGALYTRDARVLGFAISNAGTADLAAAAAGVNRLLAAGPSVVRIGAVLPFSEVARAHRILDGAEPAPDRGRLVLVPDGAGVTRNG